MQQLTCTGPGRVEWRDVPTPRLESDAEALVRPLAVARCDIDSGRLRPGDVTTRSVPWDQALEAFLEPAIKLVVHR